MSKKIYAKRYAQAAFELAGEKQETERLGQELGQLALLSRDAAIVAFLENPRVPFEKKMQLLSERLGEMSVLAKNLVSLLVSRRRMGGLGAIARDYQALLDRQQGVERARVTTAVPLEPPLQAILAERLGTLLGKKVVLELRVDPAVLGGVVARAGDKLIDGSVRSRLAALKRELAGMRL